MDPRGSVARRLHETIRESGDACHTSLYRLAAAALTGVPRRVSNAAPSLGLVGLDSQRDFQPGEQLLQSTLEVWRGPSMVMTGDNDPTVPAQVGATRSSCGRVGNEACSWELLTPTCSMRSSLASDPPFTRNV